MPGVKANTQSKGGEKEKVGGGGKAGKEARTGGQPTTQCAICKQAVNANAPKAFLMQHVDSKHAKAGFEACFPHYSEAS